MNKLLKRYLSSNKSGFTVVELIVVIVVISILATIVLVAYPGYQTRIRNDIRRSDLSQISAAIKAYAQKNDNYIENGSGCGQTGSVGGNGMGWLNVSSSDSSGYSDSVVGCLQKGGFLDNDHSYTDPSGCITTTTKCKSEGSGYMKRNCTLNGKKAVYLLAYIVGEPPKVDEINNRICDTSLDYAKYKMNYYLKVN